MKFLFLLLLALIVLIPADIARACSAPPVLLPPHLGEESYDIFEQEMVLIRNLAIVPNEKETLYFKLFSYDGGPGSCGPFSVLIRKDVAGALALVLIALVVLGVRRIRRK